MLLLENINLAFAALKSNKTRAFLTMLGIIIGIAAVIAIMTVGNSMTNGITEQMGSRGVKNITVGLERKDYEDEFGGYGMFFGGFDGPKRDLRKEDYITDEMIDKLRENFGDRIAGVALTENVGNGRVVIDSEYANISVSGINEDAFTSQDLEIVDGRGFYTQDFEKAKKVVLVSDYFCNNLYNGDTAAVVGKNIRVTLNGKYYNYTVIGVYKYDSSSSFGGFGTSEYDTLTNMYMPFLAAKNQTHNSKGYSQITVVGSSIDDLSSLSDEVEEYINNKFYRNNENYQVSTFAVQSMIEDIQKEMNIIATALSVIAGISLLVSGIGVMNIMLVSITERTKEIGTRKALGATNASIRVQFVVESIVICLIGGILGIILGIIVGMVAAHFMNYPGSASISSIVVSVVFSAAIGIFFGYYPANKAAKMNPIDALRYE